MTDSYREQLSVVGRERTNMGSPLTHWRQIRRERVDRIRSGWNHTGAHRDPEGVLFVCQHGHADSFTIPQPKPSYKPQHLTLGCNCHPIWFLLAEATTQTDITVFRSVLNIAYLYLKYEFELKLLSDWDSVCAFTNSFCPAVFMRL